MPIGLVVMKWDERTGAEIIFKYPENTKINSVLLLQIFSQHEYSGEPGTISLTGEDNVLSYYSGPLRGYYIITVLDKGEDPDDYESCVVEVSQTILQNIREDNCVKMIPLLFKKIFCYPELTEEQMLLSLLHNEYFRLVIERLRDEAVVDKYELAAWLKDKYRKSYIDPDAVFIELIKLGLVKESSISGKMIPHIMISLIEDILIFRYPPSNIHEALQEEVKEFFKTYKPTKEDNLIIIEILVNPLAYELLCLLRVQSVTRDSIYEKINKIPELIDPYLDQLEAINVIKIFKDSEGKEHFSLFSDILIERFFPRYVFNIIKSNYLTKTSNNNVLIEYLNILEIEYLK